MNHNTPDLAKFLGDFTNAAHETPVNVVLARAACAGFNAMLPQLDTATKLRAIEDMSVPMQMAAARLDHAADEASIAGRDELLGQSTIWQLVVEGLTQPAQANRTDTRQRVTSGKKS